MSVAALQELITLPVASWKRVEKGTEAKSSSGIVLVLILGFRVLGLVAAIISSSSSSSSSKRVAVVARAVAEPSVLEDKEEVRSALTWGVYQVICVPLSHCLNKLRESSHSCTHPSLSLSPSIPLN